MGLEVEKVDELVGLPPQFVSDRECISFERGDDGHALAAPLECLQEMAEAIITGKEHDMICFVGQIHCIHRHFDTHVAGNAAVAVLVGRNLGRLRDEGEPVVFEPIDQRPDGRMLILHDDGRIIKGTDQMRSSLKELQELFEVDLDFE
jgi:hypothetical protein